MATDVSICNQALGLLGQERILSLNEPATATEARRRSSGLCKDLLGPTRDAMLGEQEWAFSRKQARLAAEVTQPLIYYSHQFPLPPDCINVTWCASDPDNLHRQLPEWERVGDRLYARLSSDNTAVYIWYVRRVEDAQQFPAPFADALATRLAAEMAYPLTESMQRQQSLWAIYQRKESAALAGDGQQGRTRRTYINGLTKVRGTGRFEFFQSSAP